MRGKMRLMDSSDCLGDFVVPTINYGRDTALPCPLYHSVVTGINITNIQLPFLPKIMSSEFRIPSLVKNSNLKTQNSKFSQTKQ